LFLKPTVLVVGAGASAEFSFPTGADLYTQAMSDEHVGRLPGQRVGYEADFLSSFTSFLGRSDKWEYSERFTDLQKHLRVSQSRSIDLYAYNNPSQSEIAKLFTAWRLIKQHFEITPTINQHSESTFKLIQIRPWLERDVGRGDSIRPNWVGSLAQNYIAGAKDSSDLERNNLTIVTFNYDTIIEEAFPAIIRADERFQDAPDTAMPDVIHVHGKMAPITHNSLNFQFYERQAERIKFITDTIDSPSKEIKRASEKLVEAIRVYSVGFAFDPLNCDLIQAGQWGNKAWG
jgi:hypothetical protein